MHCSGSPFLNTGITWATIQESGNCPDRLRQKLNSSDSGLAKGTTASRCSLFPRPSGPVALIVSVRICKDSVDVDWEANNHKITSSILHHSHHQDLHW